MKVLTSAFAAGFLLALAAAHSGSASAAERPRESGPAKLTPEAEAGETDGALAVAKRFAEALAAGNREAVLECLAPEVVIFEHGGAELSREEYAGHHLDGDLAYLAEITVRVVDRKVLGGSDRAVVLTRTESGGQFRGKPVSSRGTETLVLERRGDRWRIVHVHWSSGRAS